jgi:hypothetical protein
MFKLSAILVVFLLLSAKAWAVDEFAGIKCSVDIPKALLGKQTSNERVVVTEARHKDIGLQDLGGDEISDRLFLIGWQICGNEYELLLNTKTSRVLDVIAVPSHTKTTPEAIGGCQVNGEDIPEAIIALLDNSANYNPQDSSLAKKMLKVKIGWKIDEAHQRFVSLPPETIGCPLGTVVTRDGGS